MSKNIIYHRQKQSNTISKMKLSEFLIGAHAVSSQQYVFTLSTFTPNSNLAPFWCKNIAKLTIIKVDADRWSGGSATNRLQNIN